MQCSVQLNCPVIDCCHILQSLCFRARHSTWFSTQLDSQQQGVRMPCSERDEDSTILYDWGCPKIWSCFLTIVVKLFLFFDPAMPCMASITGHSILALSLFCFLFSPALAAPLLNPEQKLRTRQDSTTAYLPGINFAYAQQECDANQLVHLRRAFTEVRDLAYATNPLSPAAGDDPPFVQFFGIGYIGVYGRYFWKVFENLRKAGDFPSQGVGPGEANQVSVHCADIGNYCTGRT
jgi:hypothetical protein